MKIIFIIVFFITSCSVLPNRFSNDDFKIVNYQNNITQILFSTNTLENITMQTKYITQKLNHTDISKLLQADILFNKGDFNNSLKLYTELSLKYNNPKIIYKIIMNLSCLPYTVDIQNKINFYTNIYLKISPNSNISVIFNVKINLERNNSLLAIKIFDILMKKNPDKQRNLLLFLSYILTSNYYEINKQTLNIFTDYILNKYPLPESHLFAVISYSYSKDINLLTKQFNYIQNIYPTWTSPLQWSLNILNNSHNFLYFINSLKNVVENKNASIYFQIFYLNILIDNNQSGIANDYLKSNINKSNNNIFYLYLTIIAIKNNKLDLSLQYLNKIIINSDEISQSVILISAIIYDVLGNWNEAILKYKLITNEKLIDISNLLLLKLYLSNNKIDESYKIIDKTAQNNKLKSSEKLLLQADILAKGGFYNLSWNIIKNEFNNNLENQKFLSIYALVASELGYNEATINSYKLLIKLNPNEAINYNNLAYYYANNIKNYNTALSYALISYKLNPLDSNILDTLGWIYYNLKDYNQALLYLRLSYDLKADSITASHLTAVYNRLKLKNEIDKLLPKNDDKFNTDIKLNLISNLIQSLITLSI